MKAKVSFIIFCLATSSVLNTLLVHPTLADDSGGKIVYVTYLASEGNDGELHIMDADGTNDIRLTNNDIDEYGPKISPDGTKIAFTVYDDIAGEEAIYTMNIDGSNRMRIVGNPDGDFQPDWSPDGSKLAFASYRTGLYEIFTLNADGSNEVQITDGSASGKNSLNPVWSPDGAKIAFDDFNKIYIMDTDGSNPISVTGSTNGEIPAWSPDGTTIAYQAFSGNRVIRLISTDGSNMVDLTSDSVDSILPTWSPDGTKLAYAEENNIITINKDGTNKTQLTFGTGNDSSFNAHWGIAAPANDPDGIDSATEAAAPNNGDANDDGIADSIQANVSSFVNPVTGSYVSIQSSCTSNNNISAGAESASFKDAGFDYPAGLVAFTLACASPGTTTSVAAYFYNPPSNITARKYNSSTHTYQAVENATLQNLTIGGQSALKVLYSITDGSTLDQDQIANGTIIDPLGLGQIVAGAPRTGINKLHLLRAPFL